MTAGYLWKELGTTCRNLPQVHTIMRMIRLITEIVCPGAILKGDEGQVSLGIRQDLMMHAAMMCMAGFPMLSSGDEIGQLNGCGYHEVPDLCEDSRNLHRTRFNWDNAALCTWPGTVQQRIWNGLQQLERLRASEPCFAFSAWVSTWDTHNDHVLALVRRTEKRILVCLFNFSDTAQEVNLDALDGVFAGLITKEKHSCAGCVLRPYQYAIQV